MLQLLRKLGSWIDDQTGIVSMVHEFMGEPLAEKVGWPHALGSAVAFCFLLQLATGAFMMIYYVPTPDHAYETVEYMQSLAFGQLVRGLHHFGATAMVVFVGLHLLQVFIWGAYKRPRQMIWVLGLALLGVTFAFSFTGYLLPWDQKAYWATVVGTNIAGVIPYVGGFLRGALRGGENVGAATLTRFFMIHVFLLPVALELLVAFHIFQVRHHGITPPWAVGEPEDVPKPQRFFPHQIAKDCVLAGLVLAVLMVLAVVKGAPLEPMASPSDTNYLPRPEWYFLPMFQLLKYLPGKYGEFVGAIVLPGLGFLALLLFPYLDRNPHRLPQRRPLAMGMMVLVLTGVTVFGVQGLKSIPPKTKLSAAARQGEKVFIDLRCDACHPINGVGGNIAPDLGHAAARSPQRLEKLLRDPSAFAPRSIMPKVDLPPAKLGALVAFLQEVDEHYELTRVPSVGPKKPYSHSEENWFLAHRFEMRKDPAYCESCHQPSFCQTCHQRRKPDSHLDHWLRFHYGVAKENPLYCKACHEQRFCDDCHRDVLHTKGWLSRHASVANQRRDACGQCHQPEFCQSCHGGARPSSHTGEWLARHGAGSTEDCSRCHAESFCQNCHTGAKPASHTPDWQQAHGRAAKGGRQKCATCHRAPFCSSCHGTQMPHPPGWQARHGRAAKPNPGACLRCHKRTLCDQCHGLELPHPRGFRATHDELAAQTPALCAKCHPQPDCRKCHDQYGRPKSHDAADFGKTHGQRAHGKEALCELCHGQRKPFVPSASCSRCHGLEMPHPRGFRAKHDDLSAKSPQLCVHCHTPTDCQKCHDEYSPPVSHDAADYGKTHGAQSTGREVYCAQCHGKTGCADCHKQKSVTVPPPAK